MQETKEGFQCSFATLSSLSHFSRIESVIRKGGCRLSFVCWQEIKVSLRKFKRCSGIFTAGSDENMIKLSNIIHGNMFDYLVRPTEAVLGKITIEI